MGMVLCGVAGVARSFVTSYTWFLILEFTDAMFGAGTYACGFILGKYYNKYICAKTAHQYYLQELN